MPAALDAGGMKVLRREDGRRRWAVLWLLGLLLAGGAGAVALAHNDPGGGVLKVRVGGDARRTRVVIELDRQVTGRLLSGEAPSTKVVLALTRASVVDDMAGQGAGLVRGWTVDDAGGAARLKLDLAGPAVVTRRFLLAPADGVDVYRYVLDVERRGPEAATSGAAPVAPPSRPLELAVASSTAPKVIVIDAGHGGKDPGSSGSGVREKEVTLAAARALRDELQRSGRFKVVLTRDTDVFVPLEQRVRMARRANADLFLSLHADTGTEPGLRGVSAYTLSDRGGERVSRKVIGGGDYFIDVNLGGGDPTVKQILLDLAQRETRNQSAVFADRLLDRVGRRTALVRRSHRSAGFVVLFAPDVPAVLMEMGFLTNGDDASALADPAARRRMMAGVAEAIEDHFAEGRRTLALR